MEVFQLLLSGLSQGCVYGLIALGFVMIYKATEMLNFAQGDMMMLGAFVAFTFVNLAGLPFFVGFLITLVVMVGFGMGLERTVIRPMIGEPPFAVLMLTIGLGFILRAVAGAIWGSGTRTLDVPFAGRVLEVGGVVLGYENLVVIGGTALLCIGLWAFFRYSRIGIAMQAASQNQLAAYYCGVPVKRVTSLVWGISAAISAAAGVLVAPVMLIDPMMGFLGIKAFAAAIVGGFGSLPGAIVGGLLIGVVEQFAGLYLPAGLGEVSAFVILLVMLMARPQGIFASMQQKKV
ncbi:MAG: branched-chain amino acid ABC transporter permease [Gammaproteobacteria bacterium]|nr:branched-chain amino acid ABC transporter permease [Gammaproteobacteria bacterium]